MLRDAQLISSHAWADMAALAFNTSCERLTCFFSCCWNCHWLTTWSLCNPDSTCTHKHLRHGDVWLNNAPEVVVLELQISHGRNISHALLTYSHVWLLMSLIPSRNVHQLYWWHNFDSTEKLFLLISQLFKKGRILLTVRTSQIMYFEGLKAEKKKYFQHFLKVWGL